MRPRRSSSAELDAVVARRLATVTGVPDVATGPGQHEDDPAAPGSPWTVGATRVRSLPVDPSPPGQEEPGDLPDAAPLIRPPGRHADRRPFRLRSLVPPTLRGEVGLGLQHVAVVAVLACFGLAVTCWWLVRADGEEVVGITAVSAEPTTAEDDLVAATGAPVPAGTGPTPAGQDLVIHVAGKVRRPGIVVLSPGARVADAIEAGGGARRGVDLAGLNLARPVVDGEQILVGVQQPPGGVAPPAGGGTPSGAAAPGGPGPVNLNTADQATLETLPGVGPVTAVAILTWRQTHGQFTSVGELIEVDGIGEKTLAVLTPLVTV